MPLGHGIGFIIYGYNTITADLQGVRVHQQYKLYTYIDVFYQPPSISTVEDMLRLRLHSSNNGRGSGLVKISAN